MKNGSSFRVKSSAELVAGELVKFHQQDGSAHFGIVFDHSEDGSPRAVLLSTEDRKAFTQISIETKWVISHGTEWALQLIESAGSHPNNSEDTERIGAILASNNTRLCLKGNFRKGSYLDLDTYKFSDTNDYQCIPFTKWAILTYSDSIDRNRYQTIISHDSEKEPVLSINLNT